MLVLLFDLLADLSSRIDRHVVILIKSVLCWAHSVNSMRVNDKMAIDGSLSLCALPWIDSCRIVLWMKIVLIRNTFDGDAGLELWTFGFQSQAIKLNDIWRRISGWSSLRGFDYRPKFVSSCHSKTILSCKPERTRRSLHDLTIYLGGRTKWCTYTDQSRQVRHRLRITQQEINKLYNMSAWKIVLWVLHSAGESLYNLLHSMLQKGRVFHLDRSTGNCQIW